MQNLTIRGREFTVEGPTPHYGTYLLTGARGAAYLALPMGLANQHIFKVLGYGRAKKTMRDLYLDGNRVLLTDEDGELREWAR